HGFEVMMQGRHLKDAFAVTKFVASHLQDHRDGFEHKNASDKEQQNLLLDQYGDYGHRAAQPERAHVAHKDFGGMRVVPEEAETGPGHGAAENSELAGARIARELQILGKFQVAAGIGEHGEGASGDDRES